MKIYKFHEDPGHGYLEVTFQELVDLGIHTEITSFSYRKGHKCFLEEDCDAPLFINTLKHCGIEYKLEFVIHDNRPFDRYPNYHL